MRSPLEWIRPTANTPETTAARGCISTTSTDSRSRSSANRCIGLVCCTRTRRLDADSRSALRSTRMRPIENGRSWGVKAGRRKGTPPNGCSERCAERFNRWISGSCGLGRPCRAVPNVSPELPVADYDRGVDAASYLSGRRTRARCQERRIKRRQRSEEAS
jgi:hypothetical protein